MEFEISNVKPHSTREQLRQQVEEQSDVCDIIVKVGAWVRKFHKCVLVASPFFNSILNNDFLERKTGIIDIKFGSSLNVEAAIWFLYGKNPKVSLENAYELIGLAEFLLIPNLKAACVKSLQQITVDNENCMALLQITSVYNFEFKKCQDYIDGHLSELLLLEPSLSIAEESIEYILTEEKYSYILMGEKLLFILKWVACLPNRVRVLQQLLKCINLSEIDSETLEEIKRNQALRALADACGILCNECDNMHKLERVLILQNEENKEILWLYSAEKERWYQYKPVVMSSLVTDPYSTLSGVASNEGLIYRIKKAYGNNMVFTHNLSNDEVQSSKIVAENGENIGDISNIYINHRTMFMIVNQTSETNKKDSVVDPEALKMEQRRLMSILGGNSIFYHPRFLMQYATYHQRRNLKISTTTLYKGQMDNTEYVKMIPVVMILDHTIMNICAYNSTVAMFSAAEMCAFLYDTNSCHLEKVDITKHCTGLQIDRPSYDSHIIAPKQDGLVVYNGKYVIDISCFNDPSLPSNYKVRGIKLETVSSLSFVNYKYCENHWYRFVKKCYEDTTFQVCSHIELIDVSLSDSDRWKTLPLPKNCVTRSYSTGNLYMINLPKNKLRCPINCVHCKNTNTRTSQCAQNSFVQRHDEYYYHDDDENDDESDDAYLYATYDDDDDDNVYYYYNDSD